MAPALDISEFSEDELTDLIHAAKDRRNELRDAREREAGTGPYGSKGQDVHDPDHGAIAAPTPNEVEEVGSEHGAERRYRQA